MPTTKNDLELENKTLNQKVQKLQKTIGVIRRGVGQIVVPRDQAETMQKVMEVIDRAIDRS
tara:strand:+ start:523 stop:705 length:183 start_codon:yes stop_codon:yes gene_type:complete